MSTPRFHFLLQQLKTGQLSLLEAAEFRQMLADSHHDEWLAADIEAVLEKNERHALWTEEKQAMLLQATLERVREKKRGEEKNTAVLRRMPLRRYAWAAAAVLAFAIALIWWQPKKVPELAVQPAGRPGWNKAILKLDKGRQIVLDSNSSLQVENARVANGEVAYTAGEGVSYNTLETPRGGQYRVVLPDGSKVWLNSASSLHYPTAFNQPTREVVLTGEAYFEIAENKAKPFIVKTRSEQVQVLGTGFNVMAYDDEDAVLTTLVQGSVKLIAGANEQLIMPGQQGRLADNQFVVSRPDLEQVLAWKNGMFNLNGANINAIMRQVMRWYDVDVVYIENLSNIELSGIISQRKDVHQLLEILEETGKVHFLVEGRKITVLPGSSR